MKRYLIIIFTAMIVLSPMFFTFNVLSNGSRLLSRSDPFGNWTDPLQFSTYMQFFGSSYGNRIIHYGFEDLHYSGDGGRNWTSRASTSDAHYTLGPSNVYKVYRSGSGEYGKTIYFSTSSDNGSSWTRGVQIFQLNGRNDGAFGIFYFNSTLMVYSYDFINKDNVSIYFSRSTNQGMVWTSPVAIDSGLYIIDPISNDIISCNGNLFISYYNITNTGDNFSSDIYVIESTNMGDSWGKKTKVGSSGINPVLKTDNGTLYLTYMSYPDERGVKFTKSSNGISWTTPKLVGPTDDFTDWSGIHSIAVRNRTVFIGYTFYNNSYSPKLSCKINYSVDNGLNWQNMGNAINSTNDTVAPNLLITGGRLHFFWIKLDSNGWDGSTFYKSRIFDSSFEVKDTDGDGYPDDIDQFPDDPNEWRDSDRDGVGDNSDAFPYDPNEWNDSDGDGVGDNGDVFPENPNEWMDTDGDGVGDNSDAFPDDPNEWMDTDGDGIGDHGDAFPDDPNEWDDTDEDGIGDNSDAFPDDPNEWMDTDGDGVGDNGDAFPGNPSEWNDMDLDGIGDNSDAFPNDPNEWMDTDGDGVGDNGDAFPGNPSEWNDMDLDGIGDNSDAFPFDPDEWIDTDGDEVGDNSDVFPDDPNEWNDTDEDGFGDNSDVFPNDPSEWNDTDGDGVGDNGDAFPGDPNEWGDTDGDGVGDNSDVFPEDAKEWIDTDGDGVGDNSDAFPNDPAASIDTDGDGYPDQWNEGKDASDSTTRLELDAYPNDPEKWEKKESEKIGWILIIVFGTIIVILLLLGIGYFIYVRRSKDRENDSEDMTEK